MHKDHANEQISEIKQETISNGNKFNEETRQDYQELIDKAIFSFVGIPPLIGFFAKQMVLSAALDSGYVFLALIAILTSVISAVYYLG